MYSEINQNLQKPSNFYNNSQIKVAYGEKRAHERLKYERLKLGQVPAQV